MEDLTDSFDHMQVKKALFTDDMHSDEEDTTNVSSWKTMRRSFSCGNIREDFHPAEVGLQMILRDQCQEAQAGNMLQTVTSCSSWAVNSQHHLPEGFEKTVNLQCEDLFLNCKEFTAGSAVTSTPISSNASFLFPTSLAVSKTKDMVVKTSKECDHETAFARRDSSLFPMLLHCRTTSNELNAPIIFGKKTKTLDAVKVEKEPSRPSSSSKGISRFQSLDNLGSDDTTLRSSVTNNARNLRGKETVWIVQPQALELDVNGKGRLLLINKSSHRNLKFKIVFDAKLISVCPQSGHLKSKSQLGLRVNASRCKNEDQKQISEVIIRITCGNEDKRVPIKFSKMEKIKSIKDRSFKCF